MCELQCKRLVLVLPGSESEFPVGDWHKLDGMKTLFLDPVRVKNVR